MIITRETYKKLKSITGIKQSYIAEKFGISRQALSDDVNAKFTIGSTVTHQNSHKFMIMTVLDEKIKEYKNKIIEIERFKEEIIKVE